MGAYVSAGIKTSGMGLDSPDAFPCLALRKLHFAESFAWRLCIHTNGKFAIGYMKQHRNEGGWQRQVNSMALKQAEGKVLQNELLCGTCSKLKAQAAMAVACR